MGDKIVKSRLTQYLFSKADKTKTPISGALEISPLCNMDCKMCYVKMTKQDMNKVGRERTVEEWLELAKELKEAGTLFLLITGGEPFLYKGFKELYINLFNMGFVISINSNATLINEETISWLKKYPPMRVNVTLYGGSNETYERLCNNKKGFDQAIRGIELMQSAGIQVKINSSITQYNVCDIEKIYEFGKNHDLIVQGTTYMYPPVRRNKSSVGKNNRFTAKEAAINYVKIKKLRMGDEEFKSHTKNFINGILEKDDLIDECMVVEGQPMKCRAGVSTFWISWDGRMMSCGMMNEPIAYPFEYGFKNAWNKIVEETSKIRLPIKCSNCKNKSICNVCAASCASETGCTSKVPTYMCEMTEEIINETKRIYNEIEKK